MRLPGDRPARGHPERRAPAVDHEVALASPAWARDLSGADRSRRSPCRRRGRAVRAGSARGQAPGIRQALEQHTMETGPDPASCQSLARRQQVIPEQPMSRGNLSQGVPERRTKMIPANATRLPHRGRPPSGLGGSGGRSGANAARRSRAQEDRSSHSTRELRLLDALSDLAERPYRLGSLVFKRS
jgi:hypothetical protein